MNEQKLNVQDREYEIADKCIKETTPTPIQMLRISRDEIKRLNRQIEIMDAKLQMFDKCMMIVTAQASYYSGHGSKVDDTQYQLDKYIAMLEAGI